MAPEDLEVQLKSVLVKDLRTQCRARGLSPAGGKDTLVDRLTDAMRTTGDYTLKGADGQVDITLTRQIMGQPDQGDKSFQVNNYHRPEGQNVGNFLTDRSSSRVLAPPGGGSQVSFGMGQSQMPKSNAKMEEVSVPEQPVSSRVVGGAPAVSGQPQSNNYARPGGLQNVGNFITERSTSRVLAPPGGTSNVTFG